MCVLWMIKMTECGMNHNGLCGLQSAGNLPFKCNGTEVCPIFRKMLALESLASKEEWMSVDGDVTYTFTGEELK